jgi:hypothetical protein
MLNSQVLKVVRQYLAQFAATDGFEEVIANIFGDDSDRVGSVVRQQWLDGDFSLIPEVRVVFDGELGTANGGYAAALDQILVSADFLARHEGDVAAVAGLLLEEIGHKLDWVLNGDVDSPGDEGAIFSALVLGTNLSEKSWEQLRRENDSVVLVLDEKKVDVELSEAGNTIDTALDLGAISYSLTPPLGVPIFKGYDDFVGGDDSDDYFKFTIDQILGSDISFTSPSNTMLELLDHKGNRIKSLTSASTSTYYFTPTQISQNLVAGTYYLHLSTTNTSASYYNLAVLFAPPDNIGDSSATAQDLGTLTATLFANGDYLFGYNSLFSLYDTDSYKFTLSQTSSVDFGLIDDAQSFTSLFVYSSLDGSPIANLSNDATKTSATLQKTLGAGTYIVSLNGTGAYSPTSSQSIPTAYTLNISATAGSIIEPGNMLQTALDLGVINYDLTPSLGLPIFKEYTDFVGGDDSDDYFKFTVANQVC